MAKTSRMGRPKLPPGEKLSVNFTIPLRPSDNALIERAAKKAGDPVARAWARQILIAAARRMIGR